MNDRDKPRLELPLEQYLKSELPADLEDTVWAKLSARRERTAGSTAVTLPLPLGDALLDGEEMAPERARLWRSVRARVRRPARRRLPRRMALAFAAALGAAVAGAVFALTLHRWEPAAPIARVERAGALLSADGRAIGSLDAQASARVIRLSDRSEIRLERGGRIEPVLSTSSRFELLLARGAAEFAVTPGGPRRWSIDAGPARVEVVGTVFRVERLRERVNVSVSRGVVLVFGEDVPGRVRRLTAGQALSVPVRPEPASAEEAHLEPSRSQLDDSQVAAVRNKTALNRRELPQATNEAPALTPHAEHPAVHGKRRTASAAADGPNAEGPHQRYAQLGPAGLARETMKATSIEQLLELADVARLSGHPQDAVAPLTRALDAFRGNPQAALAAFTLGRVLLDQLGVAQPAAEAFERAIVLKLPKALRADCYRRLAEAYGRAGNEAERARAEGRFQTEFALPSGALDKVAP